ncbi:MAG: HAD family phosphatase [Acidimicrobiales bacterium]|nr:HAD family phosphatase [Acidimicrobiales bacterium]
MTTTAPPGPISTVLFDFAGVVTSSPWGPLTAAGGGNLELLIGVYADDGDHPWHRVERGELAITDWAVEVAQMGQEQGVEVDFSLLQGLLGDMTVNEQIVDRIRRLRGEGYRVGLITNNVREGSTAWRAKVPVDELFDVVIDSCEVGMRKPNPAIYHHALELLGGIEPAAAVFLDDAPGNVEGAKAAGLAAILVDDPDAAIAELDELLAAASAAS